MDKINILDKVENYVKELSSGDPTGHDWWHVWRVRRTAKTIAAKEGGDLFIVELAALLHDIGDWKFNDADEAAGSKKTAVLLGGSGVDEKTIARVGEIVDNVSFKGAGVGNKITTKEGMIVQDADRDVVLVHQVFHQLVLFGDHQASQGNDAQQLPSFVLDVTGVDGFTIFTITANRVDSFQYAHRLAKSCEFDRHQAAR